MKRWDFEGPFKPLHVMNPTRLAFIHSTLCQHLRLIFQLYITFFLYIIFLFHQVSVGNINYWFYIGFCISLGTLRGRGRLKIFDAQTQYCTIWRHEQFLKNYNIIKQIGHCCFVATRGAHGLVGAVFFQIFYRTDRGWFFHN